MNKIYMTVLIVCSILCYSCPTETDTADSKYWSTTVSDSSATNCFSTGSNFFKYSAYAGKTENEFTFSVSKNAGAVGKTAYYGAVFWFTDWKNYYAFNMTADGSYQVVKVVNGNEIGINYDDTDQSIVWNLDESNLLKTGLRAVNTITLSIEADTLTVYANTSETESAANRILVYNIPVPAEFPDSFGNETFFRVRIPQSGNTQTAAFTVLSETEKEAAKYTNGWQNNGKSSDIAYRVFYADRTNWYKTIQFEDGRSDDDFNEFTVGMIKDSGSPYYGGGFAFCYNEADDATSYYFFGIDTKENYVIGKVYGSDVMYYNKSDKEWYKMPHWEYSEFLNAGFETENKITVKRGSDSRTFDITINDMPSNTPISFSEPPQFTPLENGHLRFMPGIGDARYEDLKNRPVQYRYRVIAETPDVTIISTGSRLRANCSGTSGILSYQWYKDDVLIPNANSKTQSIDTTETGSTYKCVVTNTIPSNTLRWSASGEGVYPEPTP